MEDVAWREDDDCDDRSVSVTTEYGRFSSLEPVAESANGCESVSGEMRGVTDWLSCSRASVPEWRLCSASGSSEISLPRVT